MGYGTPDKDKLSRTSSKSGETTRKEKAKPMPSGKNRSTSSPAKPSKKATVSKR